MSHVDVAIIGSGFGGSVSALRLTEKGYRVAVFEAGRRFADADLPKTSWRLRSFLWAPRLGLTGIQRIHILKDVVVLAGAGVAIGAAWSGLLGNFAAGAFMLVLRPFKVGDFVSIGGVVGTVRELGLFGTAILTPDNVLTIVGNGKIFGDTIQNFSAMPVRRVDRIAQLANGVDPLDAIARFKAAVAQIPNVSKDMPPEVNLIDFKLEGPQIAIRPYTHTNHYWQVYFDTNEAIVKVCQEAGWPVPSSLYLLRQS